MKSIFRFSAIGLATLLSACATTDSATFSAQCDVKSADWQYLPVPPQEAAKLSRYFKGQKNTPPDSIHWFESTKAPRELLGCTPSFLRSHDGYFTGCASVRVKFSAQVLKDGVGPDREILEEITGC